MVRKIAAVVAFDVGRGRATNSRQNVQGSRLAALLFRRGYRHSWRMPEALKGVGVNGPQCQRFGATIWQDKVAFHCIADVVQKIGAIDGLGPRLNCR